jgi:hypothetical protein
MKGKNMKKTIKLMALLLAILCFVSAFAACNENTSGSNESESKQEENNAGEGTENIPSASEGSQTEAKTEETEESVAEEAFPNVEKNNYNTDFYLSIQAGGTNPIKYYWVEEGENDAMSEAIYARQTSVRDYLGVEIVGSEAGAYDQYADTFKNSVKNKDGSVNVLQTHVYFGLVSMITENYLLDYRDMPGIDLYADYWNHGLMTSLAAGDRLFLGYSNYNLANTHVITFNKSMMEKYEDALSESVYSMVDNYRWTLDQMISIAELVYVDQTSNGKTDDDIFGITGHQWVPFCAFIQSSGIDIVDINEKGEYYLSVYNDLNKEKCTTLVEKLHELTKSNCSWFWYRTEGTPNVTLISGRTLMYIQSSFGLADNLGYDIDFGVLPYPMFDEAQKDVGYRSLDWGGLLVIPNYLEDKVMTGETLEMMAFFSDNVTLTFYEKLLGKQVADAPEDKRMLDVIWDSVCSDFGLTYSHMSGSFDSILYMIPNLTYANTTNDIASYVRSNEKGCNKALQSFFKKIDKLP